MGVEADVALEVLVEAKCASAARRSVTGRGRAIGRLLQAESLLMRMDRSNRGVRRRERAVKATSADAISATPLSASEQVESICALSLTHSLRHSAPARRIRRSLLQ